LEPVFIPDTDHFYEVNPSPGLFSSDSFSVDLSDSGSVQKVTATSDPQFSEALKAATAIAAAGISFLAVDGSKCPPIAPSDPELGRLRIIKTKLEATGDALLEQKTLSKQDIDTLRIIQDQLATVQAAIKTRNDNSKAKLALDANTITDVSYNDPDQWLRFGQEFPDAKEIIEEFTKRGKKKRVFVYVRPAVDFKSPEIVPTAARN
jgi:hypothetical protein